MLDLVLEFLVLVPAQVDEELELEELVLDLVLELVLDLVLDLVRSSLQIVHLQFHIL